MNGEKYIKDAKTPEDHLNNCLFQAQNVAGWLTRDRECARIKAECLLREAELLLAACEAEARKGEKFVLVRPTVNGEQLHHMAAVSATAFASQVKTLFGLDQEAA